MQRAQVQSAIHAVLCANPVVALATASESFPGLRYMMTFPEADLTVRAGTRISSRKVQQIRACPSVSLLAGFRYNEMGCPWVVYEGRASIHTDAAHREAIWTAEFSRYFSGPADEELAVIEVRPLRVEYWSMDSNQPVLWTQGEEA